MTKGLLLEQGNRRVWGIPPPWTQCMYYYILFPATYLLPKGPSSTQNGRSDPSTFQLDRQLPSLRTSYWSPFSPFVKSIPEFPCNASRIICQPQSCRTVIKCHKLMFFSEGPKAFHDLQTDSLVVIKGLPSEWIQTHAKVCLDPSIVCVYNI